MELKYLFALLLPGLIVILFTRVTYNRMLGLVLSVALIAASVYKGYTDSLALIIVDAFSLTVGFWYAERIKKRQNCIHKFFIVALAEGNCSIHYITVSSLQTASNDITPKPVQKGTGFLWIVCSCLMVYICIFCGRMGINEMNQ